MKGIARLMMVREAIHSTAMEHPTVCDCDVCKAADGDTDAFDRVAEEIFRQTG